MKGHGRNLNGGSTEFAAGALLGAQRDIGGRMARKGGPPLAIRGSAATERMGFPPRGLWYVASRRWEGQEEAGET